MSRTLRTSPSIRRASALLALFAALLVVPTCAQATSIAYIENGEVWLTPPDRSQKLKLASPVQRSDESGTWTENWYDVAHADNGRIVAVRNKPGRNANFAWFKIWEPDGTSTVEGPLSAPSGWQIYAYPVGFDITADGGAIVYGYSNSRFNGMFEFETGTYVRPATNSVLDPIKITGMTWPSLFGSRVIAASGSTVNVQQTASSTYGPDFTGWLDTNATGLRLHRTDVAANGSMMAIDLESDESPTTLTAKIALISTQGVDTAPALPAAVDCFIPASGKAHDASLSADAKLVAWIDDIGLRIAGVPTTAADPCVLTSPPVTLSSSATRGAIGGADFARFAAKGGTPPSDQTPPPGTKPTLPKPSQVVVAATASKVTKLSATGVLPVVATAPQSKVKLTVTLSMSALNARKFGIPVPKKAKTVVIGTVVLPSTTAGKKVTLKVKLTKAARAAIARTVKRKAVPKSTAATLTLTFGTGANTSKLVRTIALKR